MLIIAYILLPAIAIFLVAWNSRQLLGAIGWIKLEQEFNEDPQLAQRLTYERGQTDEYDSLIAMEFIPLGTYSETYGQFDCSEQYVFTHKQLPIVCHLCLNCDEQLFVVMVSDDGQGRFIRTTSCEHGIKVIKDDFIGQHVDVEFTEQVLAVHMQSVQKWEREGIRLNSVKSMPAAVEQCLNLFNHRETQDILKKTSLIVGSAPLIIDLIIPAFLTGPVWIMMNSILSTFKLPQASGLSAILVYSALSIIVSTVYRLKTIPKNPDRNSLKPRSLEEYQVDAVQVAEPGISG